MSAHSPTQPTATTTAHKRHQQPFQSIPTVLLTLITNRLANDCDSIYFIRTYSDLFHRMKSVYHLRSKFRLEFTHPDVLHHERKDRSITLTVPFSEVWKRPIHFIGVIYDLIITLPNESGRERSEVARLRQLVNDQPWPKELIPAGVRRIEFDESWKRNGPKLLAFNLPSSLVEFVSYQVDQSIAESLTANRFDKLKRLTSLHLPLFQLPLDLSQMTALRALALGRWNLPIQNLQLPSSLEQLAMGTFSQPIDQWTLPPQLRSLQLNGAQKEFKWKKDQLPPTLTHLSYFNYVYGDSGSTNITIENSGLATVDSTQLPKHLVRLSLPCLFKSSLSEVALPTNLHELNLRWNWSPGTQPPRRGLKQQFSELRLPNKLRRLKLQFGTHFSLKGVQLPGSLVEFQYADERSDMPPDLFKSIPKLRIMDLRCGFDRCMADLDFWPGSLRSLTLSPRYGDSLKDLVLPDQLEELILTPHDLYDSVLPEYLPTHLKVLHVDQFHQDDYLDQLGHLEHLHTLILGNNSTNGYLPRLSDSLRRLELTHFSRMYLNMDSLPPQLTSLSFPGFYMGGLSRDCLPVSLTDLTFGRDFNSPISLLILPITLRRLNFSLDSYFNQPIDQLKLPPDLISIILPAGYRQMITSLTRRPTSIVCKDQTILRFPYDRPLPKRLYEPTATSTGHPIKIFF